MIKEAALPLFVIAQMLVCLMILVMSDSVHAADDIRIGTIYGSKHFVGDHDWNERHHGLYGQYNGWTLGTYEHSYKGVEGYEDYSDRAIFVAKEELFDTDYRNIEVSVMYGVVTGYPERVGIDGTLPWVSFNFRFGSTIGAKLWNVPFIVSAYGLEVKL